MPKKQTRPIVMTIAGHDPSGGAGIQADMEAINYTGCHPVSVISCLTVQDTHNVHTIQCVSTDLMQQQATAILKDMPVKVIKLGLLGSIETIEAVSKLLKRHPKIPVVFDPVLAAGGGMNLSTKDIVNKIKEHLLPLTTLLTPNIPEAIALGIIKQTKNDDDIRIHHQACKNILITGTHSTSTQVHNRLFADKKELDKSSWRRLEHEYHGSGCTLASSIAGFLAQGFSIKYAVQRGQEFTWDSLRRAHKLGKGQYIPYRI